MLNFEKCLEVMLKLYEDCRLICVQTSGTAPAVQDVQSNFLDLYSAISGNDFLGEH